MQAQSVNSPMMLGHKQAGVIETSPVSPPRASAVPRSTAEYDHRQTDSLTNSVNSMSLHESSPTDDATDHMLSRKRNRDANDHSLRLNKMPEAPATVPRSQAVLGPEQYQQQQQQQQQQQRMGTDQQQPQFPAQMLRDDSFLSFGGGVPMLLSHNNSGTSGRSNSGSLMNFMSAQDPVLQESALLSLEKNAFSTTSRSSISPTPGAPTSADWAMGSTSLSALNVSQSALLPSFSLSQTTTALKQSTGSGNLSGPNFNLMGSATGGGSGSFGLGGIATSSFLQPQAAGSSSLPFFNQTSLGPFGSTGGSGSLFPPVNSSLNFNTSNMGMPTFGVPTNSMPVNMQSSSFLNGSLGSFGTGSGIQNMVTSQIGPLNERSAAGQVHGSASLFGNAYSYAKSASTPQQMDQGLSPLRKSPVTSSSKPRKPSSLANSAQAELRAAKTKVPVPTMMEEDKSEKYVSWSPEQEAALSHAVEELGGEDWETIATRIPGAHRTGAQCMRHWENKLSPHIKRGQWSPEEDEALKQLVERAAARGLGLLDIPWEEIKPYIPGRTLKQVRERWRSNLDPSIVRGEWTQEEDDMIIHMRDVQGMGWASIARALKGRTEHSVKTRHRSMQRAKKRPWTEKEDRTIIELVKAGSDWSTIANELKNRTAASVQMRWSELSNGAV